MSHLLRVLICLACAPLVLPAGFCMCEHNNQVTVLIGSTEHHDHNGPDDHEHDVDCPTMWRAVVAPAVSLDLSPVFAGLIPSVDPVLERVSLTTHRPLSSLSWPVDPPLYRSHCALVI